MTEFGAILALAWSLSLVVTQVVAFFRNAFDSENRAPKWIWNVTALVVGLAFALGWQLNIAVALAALVPALADKASALSGISGQVLTGFIIGMASGFWNTIFQTLKSITTRNNATAATVLPRRG